MYHESGVELLPLKTDKTAGDARERFEVIELDHPGGEPEKAAQDAREGPRAEGRGC